MDGSVVSVNISEKKGEKKTPVGRGLLVAGLGLKGDGHSGDGRRQLSLLAMDSINKIKDKGLAVAPGDFAENITTSGIALHLLPMGTMIGIGEDILLQVTQIGKECHDRCHIFYQVGDCVMPKEGIFAAVIRGGEVNAGDRLRVMADEHAKNQNG